MAALARWLPHHQDEYFLMMQAATHGQYTVQFRHEPEDERPKEPGVLRAAANRALDAFSGRADAAIRRYRERRG